jgi:hypothetical protein
MPSLAIGGVTLAGLTRRQVALLMRGVLLLRGELGRDGVRPPAELVELLSLLTEASESAVSAVSEPTGNICGQLGNDATLSAAEIGAQVGCTGRRIRQLANDNKALASRRQLGRWVFQPEDAELFRKAN